MSNDGNSKEKNDVSNVRPEYLDSIATEIKRKGCPALSKALPPWPSKLTDEAEWFGLHKNAFFNPTTHFGNKKKRDRDTGFCRPDLQFRQLMSVFKKYEGGSFLLTGYRGTGKSKLVNNVLQELKNKKKNNKNHYVPIRINLSTSRAAMALVMMMIKELKIACDEGYIKSIGGKEKIKDMYERFIYSRTQDKQSYDGEETKSKSELKVGLGYKMLGISGGVGMQRSTQHSYTEASRLQEYRYTLHEAQQDLNNCLKRLKKEKFIVVFILDELDKLTLHNCNRRHSDYSPTLLEIQNIVSDLKFILSETNAFTILIAGKEIDESWHKAQNRGDGILETTFLQNIYMPSLFSIKLNPTVGSHHWISNYARLWEALKQKYWEQSKSKKKSYPHKILNLFVNSKDNREQMNSKDFGKLVDKVFNFFVKSNLKAKDIPSSRISEWTEKVFRQILSELGSHPDNWTYNTGLLILPYFSRNELQRILLRGSHRLRGKKGIYRKKEGAEQDAVKAMFEWLKKNATRNTEEIDDVEMIHWLTFIGLFQMKLGGKNDGILLEKLNTSKADIQFTPPHVPMSERRCRRMRYLLQYLTYKGRGIPRRVLEVFYSHVQERGVFAREEYWKTFDKEISHIAYYPIALRQKIKFFANIVDLLENHQDVFRALDDKGCVATFYIINYILKYSQTGFTWSDLENAGFTLQGETLYLCRDLTGTILGLLEDWFVFKTEQSREAFRLLPRIRHDQASLYRTFGPEQIEMSFTYEDFEREIRRLSEKIGTPHGEMYNGIEGEGDGYQYGGSDNLESVKRQIKIARLYEIMDDFQEARHQYSKALRWLERDLGRTQKNQNSGTPAEVIGNSTTITSLFLGVHVAHRLGYLYELNRELDTALHYYQSAIRFNESGWEIIERERQNSILGKVRDMRTLILKDISDEPVVNNNIADFPGTLENLSENMVPGNQNLLNPFTRIYKWSRIDIEKKAYPVFIPFVPQGMGRLLNSIAVVMEKMWHRSASNRYMLLALDLYRSQFDYHQTVEQMVFIGELLMRRRDIRLATAWYLLALDKIKQQQNPDDRDKVSKKTRIRCATTAKIYEYIGDIHFATHGTAFKDLSSNAANRLTHTKKEQKKNIISPYKAEEFVGKSTHEIYQKAAELYSINNQPMRVVDVHLKMLTSLFKDVRKYHAELQQKEINLEDQFKEDLLKLFSEFWKTAEQMFDLLIDTRPTTRKVASLEIGKLLDQRRFGALFTLVGRMFMMMASQAPMNYYQMEVKICSHRESRKNLGRINRIMKRLIDCKSEIENDELLKRIYGDDAIRNRSSLWNLASNQWRTLLEDKKKIEASPLFTFRRPLLEFINVNEPNAFLTGQLYLLFDRFKKANLKYNDEKENVKAINTIKKKIPMLYQAEVSLLAAHLALDDNIRDLESANASHRLGLLYLQCIEYLFRFRHETFGDKRYYYCKVETDEKCILGDKRPSEGAGCVKRKKRYRDYESMTALLYQTLHLAAKRYLVNALDIYRIESMGHRCHRLEMGRCFKALGDLMLIRAEILDQIPSENRKNKTIKERKTLDGIDSYWVKHILKGQKEKPVESDRKEKMCDSHKMQLDREEKGKFTDYLTLLKKHIDDTDLADVRCQVLEAYRDSNRRNLSEMDEYLKRYRLPSEIYLEHNNIMDEKMHFEICHNIHIRHWDYDNAPPDKYSADSAANKLVKIIEELGAELSLPQSPVLERRDWLQSTASALNLLNNVCPTRPYIEIIKIEDENKADQTHDFQVNWVMARENSNSISRAEETIRFFRSYDDGL